VWETIFGYLGQIGTEVVFGLPDDDLCALQSLKDHHLRLILCRDQRNALFMGAGYALTRGHIGVCIVGKGPALANAITGLLESSSSSAPVLLISAGTAAERAGTHSFQETDQLALVRHVVKWAYRVEHPNRLLWAVQKAAFVALNGNPGPVYLEIPEDLAEMVDAASGRVGPPPILRAAPVDAELEAALLLLRQARRPLFLLGGGAKRHAAHANFELLAERVGAALFTTASGRGAVTEDHPLFCGVAGLYTAKPLRALWADADLIVVFGSRMEETATLLLDAPSDHQRLVQIDIEVGHFRHTHPTLKLLGDAAASAAYWANRLAGTHAVVTDWMLQIAEHKKAAAREKQALLKELTQQTHVHVVDILAALEEVLPADSVIAQENGLVDMWSYFFPYFTLRAGQGCIVPSEQTTLGFGAAAALGAKLARPGSIVVAFVGDGAFNIYRADLFTAADHDAPVIYIVLNNRSFGWLEYQARCQGITGAEFRFQGEVVASHPRVVTLSVNARTQIRDALVKACRLNAEGYTIVIDAHIPGIEPAPGIDEFYERKENHGNLHTA
jgi:acetolactate synthase-1/2/3 large subunit